MDLFLRPWRLFGFILVLVNLCNATLEWRRGRLVLVLVDLGMALYVGVLFTWIDRRSRKRVR